MSVVLTVAVITQIIVGVAYVDDVAAIRDQLSCCGSLMLFCERFTDAKHIPPFCELLALRQLLYIGWMIVKAAAVFLQRAF